MALGSGLLPLESIALCEAQVSADPLILAPPCFSVILCAFPSI